MSSPIWQRLLWVVMFLVVFEGAVRKWVLPGFQAQIFFVKDLILIAAYGAFLAASPRSGAHAKVMGGLRILFVLSSIYFIFELLNPNSPSLLVSVIGLKNYLLYMPLAFIVPYIFSSVADVEQKLRKYAILLIPFVALGLVQFMFPPDHWINGYLNHEGEELSVGGFFGDASINKVRTTGTFSYIGGFTAFLTIMAYLATALAAKNRWRISGNALVLVLLALCLAAMFTTGSRGPIWGLLATLPLVLWIWSRSGLLSSGSLGKMMAASVAIWLLAQFVAADAYDAYAYRVEHADDVWSRILSPFTESWGAVLVMGPIGTGIGSTNGGALTLMGTRDFWWLNGNLFEVEPARVLLETGLIGFILVYAARVWLLLKAITLGVRFRTPLYVALSGVIVGLFMQDLVLGFVINSATVGIYYWFSAGLLFAMYRLEAEKALAIRESAKDRHYALVKKLPA